MDVKTKYEIKEESALMEDLLRGIEEKEFQIYLQPKFDTNTELIVGAEALLRRKKGSNLMLPQEFVPFYEENGWITILDMYVLREVCKLQKKWRDEGLPLFPISINESRHHLKNDNHLKELKEIIEEEGANSQLIELEMTETTVIQDIQVAKKAAESVKKLGFLVSMDDFGTGYSAFNVLKDIEIDILKIDQSFFEDLEKNERAQIIIESIVKMCKRLKIRTVAEGIENKHQVEFLKNIQCDTIQGYYYSKPIPIPVFEEKYLKNGKKVE